LPQQELKRQSWRYHKHHNAWFQRYAEPSVTSEEYEQGTYVYFDYHVSDTAAADVQCCMDGQSGWQLCLLVLFAMDAGISKSYLPCEW
jgi:hypothetical protein